MTPQEQGMIDDLVQRIRTTPVTDKDVDAERHLQQTLGTVPDALYILAQTVLVQEYGLNQAKAQIQAKQDEIDQLKHQAEGGSGQAEKKGGGSFLSRIFGSDEAGGAAAPPPANATGYQPVNYAPAPQAGYPPPYGGQGYPGQGGPGYGSPAYGGPGYGPGAGGFGGGGGGFLRGALQTAAGVAAGAMVFEGAESLFRGFGGGGHDGREFGGSPGETVVNNYYGDEGDRGGDRDDRSSGGNNDSSFYNPAEDASRQDDSGDSRGFADTASGSDLDSGDDDDTSSFDDSSDFSGGDDSGSSDGGDDSNY